MPAAGRPRIGIIGARKATVDQLRVARALAAALTEAGGVVVSGGAEGVDTAALQGALDAGGGPLAVLPCGLNRPYPPQNRSLFDAIVAAGGGLCSVIEPDIEARQGAFLGRNVLMTQLFDALVAVAAGPRSGSLHCAGQAWLQGLPVLAVPWSPGSPMSEGSNGLLAAGARALWDAEGCKTLVTALASDGGRSLLDRATVPPGRTSARARRDDLNAVLPGLSIPGPMAAVIDGAGGGSPCYPPPVTVRAALGAPAGCDAGLAARVAAALHEAGATGLSLEELACAAGVERGQVATAVLHWVLAGQVKRLQGGLFSR